MAHFLVVGKNTYATEAEALAYLETRLRSMTAWPALTQATRLAALSSAFYMIETMWSWKGVKTGVKQLATLAIVAAGTGYVVNDVVTLVGGTGEKAQAKVTVIGALGAVTGVALIHTGYYTVAPVGTLTTTGGTGTGLTVSFTAYPEQITDWPRTGTGVDGVVDGEVPLGIKQAQSQLAFELTQDSALEVAANASQNTKRMAVGSLEIEYFRSQILAKFPPIVWSLLQEFVGGDGSDVAAQAFGIDGQTQFSEESPYGITGGGY